jgi:hypothetical protein
MSDDKNNNMFEKFNQFLKNIWLLVSVISLIAGAIMLAVIVVNTKQQDTMSQYVAEYTVFKSEAEQTNLMVQELRVQVAEKEHEAQAAMARTSQLSAQIKQQRAIVSAAIIVKDSLLEAITDTLDRARVIIPKQEIIIENQSAIIELQDSQIKNLETVVLIKDESIRILTVAVDSLQQVVINIPPPPKNPNKILGIPMPNRKVMLITGFIAGAVTTGVVVK